MDEQALRDEYLRYNRVPPLSLLTNQALSDLKIKPAKSRRSLLEITLYIMIILSIGILIVLSILFTYIDKVKTIAKNRDIPKSYNDSKVYSIIKLNNDIEITLISDIDSTTSAVSLIVGAGGLYDDEIPGLSHLTKRLMLLRSKQYNRTYFTNYISEYFGRYHSTFKDEETSFYFDIGKDGFIMALNIFGEMMTYPEFHEEIVEYEKKVINSEYKYSQKQSTVTERHILNEIVFKNRTYFPIGNNISFDKYSNEQLANQAMTIYDKYYYGGNIHIAILSNQNLKELKGMAIKAFKNIKRYPKSSTSSQKKNKEHKIISKSDLNLGQVISFTHYNESYINYHFFFDKISTNSRDEISLQYLIFLLKDRSSVSLYYSVCDLELYISSLTSKLEVIDNKLVHFTIIMKLSKYGWFKFTEITNKLFNFLKIVRDNIPKAELYQEIDTISTQSFNFSPSSNNMAFYAFKVSHFMKYYYDNITNFSLENNYLPPYDQKILSDYFSQFIPENCVISFILEKTLPGSEIKDIIDSPSNFDSSWKEEKWYRIKYAHDSLSSSAIKELNAMNKYDDSLKIRTENPYVSRLIHSVYPNFTDDEEMKNLTPSNITNFTHAKMWHKLDRTFYSPKSLVQFHIITPYIRTTSTTMYFLNKLYFEYLRYSFDNQLYLFQDSGNLINLHENNNGIFIQINCYSDLLEVLLEKMIDFIFNPQINDELSIVLSKLVNDVSSSEQLTISYQASEMFFEVVIKKKVVNINAVQLPINMNEMYKILQMPKDFYITTMFYGNINKTTSESLFTNIILPKIDQNSTQIESTLMVFNETQIKDDLFFHHYFFGSFILRLNELYLDSNQQAVNNYFFVSIYSESNDILATLITLLWQKHFQNRIYNQIENVQNVRSEKVIIDNKIYFNFIVLCLDNPMDVNHQMDKVIEYIGDIIKTATEDNLYYAKENLITRRNTKDASINSKASTIFNEIYSNNLKFERKTYTRELLKDYTLSRIIDLFNKVFYSDVRKLSLQIFKKGSNDLVIKDEVYTLNESITSTVSNDYKYFQKKIEPRDIPQNDD